MKVDYVVQWKTDKNLSSMPPSFVLFGHAHPRTNNVRGKRESIYFPIKQTKGSGELGSDMGLVGITCHYRGLIDTRHRLLKRWGSRGEDWDPLITTNLKKKQAQALSLFCPVTAQWGKPETVKKGHRRRRVTRG